jgi:hypothetical protein
VALDRVDLLAELAADAHADPQRGRRARGGVKLPRRRLAPVEIKDSRLLELVLVGVAVLADRDARRVPDAHGHGADRAAEDPGIRRGLFAARARTLGFAGRGRRAPAHGFVFIVVGGALVVALFIVGPAVVVRLLEPRAQQLRDTIVGQDIRPRVPRADGLVRVRALHARAAHRQCHGTNLPVGRVWKNIKLSATYGCAVTKMCVGKQ